MDKDFLKEVFLQQAETVQVYVSMGISSDTDDDDYSETTETLLQPVPMKAIIVHTSPEKLTWKFQGINTKQGFDLIIKASYIPTIRMSKKIVVRGVVCYGYKDTSNQLQMQNLDNYYYKVSVAEKPTND